MAQYLKPNSELGYIEDSAEITKLKFNNLRHVVLGCMLGDFNDVGDYVVSPEIVSELINMEKYILQTYDNIELCKSFLKLDKQISFMVTFEGNKATLSLVEKINYEANYAINSGTYSDINEFILDSVETSGEINRNVLYDRWNIKPFGGNVVDIFNCDDLILEKYFGIVNRFKYLLEANRIILEKEEQIEEIEASYANEIVSILEHYPQLKKEVFKTIKENLTEKKNSLSVKKPYFAKTFNEILENAIEKNLNVLNETEKKEFETEKRNSTLSLNIKREDVVEVETIEQEEKTHESDLVPQVVQVKLETVVETRSVQDLGQSLVKADAEFKSKHDSSPEMDNAVGLIERTREAVAERQGKEVEIKTSNNNSKKDEINKLIETIVSVVGKAEIIGVEPKENKKEENKVLVKDAEVKPEEKVKTEKKASATSSKSQSSKSQKSASSSKTASSKTAGASSKKSGATQTTQNPVKVKQAVIGGKGFVTRIYSTSVLGQTREQNVHGEEIPENKIASGDKSREVNVNMIIEDINEITQTAYNEAVGDVVGETEQNGIQVGEQVEVNPQTIKGEVETSEKSFVDLKDAEQIQTSEEHANGFDIVENEKNITEEIFEV